MNASRIFSRAFVAVLSIFLMAAVAVGQNLVLNGAATIGGTVRVRGNIDNTNSTGTNAFTGTVQLRGAGIQSMGGHATNVINFATLTATTATVKTFTTSSTVATAIDMTSATTTQFAVAASKKLTLQGTIANTGGAATPYDFDNSGAEVDYAGGAQDVWSGITYDKLTVSTANTKSLVGAVTVASALAVSTGDLSIGANTLTINGTYTVSGTVTGGATSNMSLGGTGNVASFAVTNGLNNFTLNRDTYTVTLGGGLSVAGALALNNGTLAVSTQTLTLQGSSGVAGSGALTSAAAGTVDYAQGSNGQSVLTADYGNLTLSSFNKTLPSATVGIAGTFTPGSASGHTITGNTIDFNGAGQAIPTFNGATGYNNFVTSGSGSKAASGAVTVAGNFDNGGAGNATITLAMGLSALSITGTRDNTSSTIQFAGASNGRLFTTGTVDYNGTTVTQTVEGHGANTYAGLVFSGTAMKLITTAAGLVRTTGNLNATTDVQVGADVLDTTAELAIDGDFTVGAVTVTNYGIITVGN